MNPVCPIEPAADATRQRATRKAAGGDAQKPVPADAAEIIRRRAAAGESAADIAARLGMHRKTVAVYAKRIGVEIKTEMKRTDWTEERDQTLRDLVRRGSALCEIAKAMGLDRRAVKRRLDKLELRLGTHGRGGRRERRDGASGRVFSPARDEELYDLIEQGLNRVEIAQAMGLTPGSVKSRMQTLGLSLKLGQAAGAPPKPERPPFKRCRLAEAEVSFGNLRRAAREIGYARPPGTPRDVVVSRRHHVRLLAAAYACNAVA